MSKMRLVIPCGLVALALGLATPGMSVANGGGLQALPLSANALTDVAQRDNYFTPSDITVAPGTTVRWTNRGYNSHTTTSDTGVWNSGLMSPGEDFSYTFNTPGSYPYYCSVHRSMGMVGRVVVTDAGSPGPSPAGNLALGRPVYASTSQAGHPAAHAVDGNAATFWASASFVTMPGVQAKPDATDASTTQWIYVDLGNTYAVNRLHMLWTTGSNARYYSVYVNSSSCGGWCLIGSTSAGDGDDTLSLTRAISGRYFMLYLLAPASTASQYELREWEVFGSDDAPSTATNVARGRPASASSEQPGYPPGRATDGIAVTEWRSARLPAWLAVDLGRPMVVNRAVLRWAPARYPWRYVLYAYNGYSWYSVFVQYSGRGGDEVANFRAVNTRYLLVYATNAAAPFVGLRELEVYGSATGSSGSPYPFDAPVEGMWGEQPDVAPPAVVPDGASLDDRSFGLKPWIDAAVTDGLTGTVDLHAVAPDLPDLPDLR